MSAALCFVFFGEEYSPPHQNTSLGAAFMFKAGLLLLTHLRCVPGSWVAAKSRSALSSFW